MATATPISYRALTTRDLAFVPLQCQGEPEEIRARIAACGSSALLAFDGERCVAQLQFRPFAPGTRSPRGLHDPLYWMDFPPETPALPARALALFCYHVGQLEGDPDSRDRRYLGRGIGQALLRHTLLWARDQGFAGVVAKGLAPSWPVLQYMGAMPWPVYEAHGFRAVHTYHDADLRQVFDEMLIGAYGAERLRELEAEVAQGVDLAALAQVRVYARTLDAAPE